MTERNYITDAELAAFQDWWAWDFADDGNAEQVAAANAAIDAIRSIVERFVEQDTA